MCVCDVIHTCICEAIKNLREKERGEIKEWRKTDGGDWGRMGRGRKRKLARKDEEINSTPLTRVCPYHCRRRRHAATRRGNDASYILYDSVVFSQYQINRGIRRRRIFCSPLNIRTHIFITIFQILRMASNAPFRGSLELTIFEHRCRNQGRERRTVVGPWRL